jgi:hypothetical protein
MSERRSIREMADDTAALIVKLKAEIETTGDRKAKKQLRSRLHAARSLERWFRSRAGYV